MRAFRLLVAQFIIVLPLAVMTWFAFTYFLYWRIWWLDIPMHFFGGVWAATCAAWLLARRGHQFSLLWCLAFALAIGITWEVFEYAAGIAVPQYLDYQVDTAKDLVMDATGAIFGWFLAKRLAEKR